MSQVRLRDASDLRVVCRWSLPGGEAGGGGVGQEWLRGSHGFRMCLGWLSDDVNLLCICSLCDEGLPGAGSRAEAVEHAAFCLRGREVSSVAVFDVLHE